MKTHPLDLDLAVRIIQSVCHEFRLGLDELASPSRTARLVWPRHLAIYLTAKHTHMAWPVIGALFNRTPASVRDTIQRAVPARLQTEPRLRLQLQKLETQI